MRFEVPLQSVKLLRRYKRFLADVQWPDGRVETVHCPNSGSMKGCVGEGWDARISDSGNPARKLRFTLEMVHNGRCWIGVNTQRPNQVAAEALAEGRLAPLAGFTQVRREVRWGEHSRIDLVASNGTRDCYVEVKNVTLVSSDGCYAFPDAVTTRGRKHLAELQAILAAGHRAAMLFVVQRSDGTHFRPAVEIDPEYARALGEAAAAGVELLVAMATVTPEAIALTGQLLPYVLS